MFPVNDGSTETPLPALHESDAFRQQPLTGLYNGITGDYILTSLQCLSAAAPFGTLGSARIAPGEIVSNAFRQQPLSGPQIVCPQTSAHSTCLQCLSAAAPFGTPGSGVNSVQPQPVSNAFRQQPLSGHQLANGDYRNDEVSNAFRQQPLSGQITKVGELRTITGSPMPFGSSPFRDPSKSSAISSKIAKSPMPFGSSPFRDTGLFKNNTSNRTKSPMPFGSSPFRDMICDPCYIGSEWSPMPFGSSPFRDLMESTVKGGRISSLQCLSAVAPFGTA